MAEFQSIPQITAAQETATPLPPDYAPKRPFSLWLYLLIVFALSWPFQIIAAIWGADLLPRYTLHAISMTMVTLGTLIAGRYVFKDGFAQAGWQWGRPKHYLAVIGFALLLWALPTIIELAIGQTTLPEVLSITDWIWITIFLLDFIPCFGEEFGWRGYMLPHLAERFSPRKAVLVHSIIWYIWHWPILIGLAVWMGIAGAAEMELPVWAAIAVMMLAILILGAVPAILHGVVFAYFWVWSASLAVVTVYHLAYDGVRDSIQTFIGSGSISAIWANVGIIALGAILLWKANWTPLAQNRIQAENIPSEEKLPGVQPEKPLRPEAQVTNDA